MPTVLIGGGSGLVGMHLSKLLRERGYKVLHLGRTPDPSAAFPRYGWDLTKGTIDKVALAKADYVINLAGAGIADKRWSKARKKIIIDSRVKSTLLFKRAFEQLNTPPKAYISASAVGYYGNRGDQLLKESSQPHPSDFLSVSTVAWENAVHQLEGQNFRVAMLRIGIVLSVQGGALPKMQMPLQFRLGTYFGNGGMYYSWIHIDDLCRMFLFAIEQENFAGIYNAVAPHPTTSYGLIKAIAKAKKIGFLPFPAPAFGLRLVLGEMADVLLSSTRVSSEKIEAAGFEYQHRDLVPALSDIFARQI